MMKEKTVPKFQTKVNDTCSNDRRESNNGEESLPLGQLEAKRQKGREKSHPDSTATGKGNSNTLPIKNLSMPLVSNPLTVSVSKGNTAYERSVNGSRITMHSNLVPTETQDVSWSEIDTLDDVKKMAKEPIINDGFPTDFEDSLTKMRRSHAQLLRLMRERNQRLKCVKPVLSAMLRNPSQKCQHDASMDQGREPQPELDDPEITLDGENYVSQIVDTIKGLHR
ncbi:hypothetical protein SMKI_02G3060 [Saccharomyces mikatae IFO 1815]|uniref:Uncharacterized protein n=1 Tax=Saccharomyces mikatae IFO 1815 TaxID=226126 RepID=A0AA35IX00_SACMI|nr:uncharacterized protein SMKI_02G3060 [Saccharomyces mikatae IFO 1815]CAI4037431.1 hypothetical protein SMKI_02G3060 [Saccharomyces mikatae IFO 1815]